MYIDVVEGVAIICASSEDLDRHIRKAMARDTLFMIVEAKTSVDRRWEKLSAHPLPIHLPTKLC